jgi:hypothetical protein
MLKEIAHYRNALYGQFDIDAYWKARKTDKTVKLQDFFNGTLKNIDGKSAEEIATIKEQLARDYWTVNFLLDDVKDLYGLGVRYDKKAKGHIVAYDRTDVLEKLTDPDLKRGLKKIIGVNALSAELSKKVTLESLKKGDHQDVIDFYNSLGVKFLKDETFSPSMILVEILRHYNKQYKGNYNNRRGFDNAFTGNAYIDYKPYYYTADADGSVFEYHPVYDSAQNNHYTDYVEKAYVPDSHGDIFKIGRMIVTSQNLLVDFNNIQTREEIAIKENIDEEVKKQRINDAMHMLSNLGVMPTPDMRARIEKGDAFNDIIHDFTKTSKYESEYLNKGKVLVHDRDMGTFKLVTVDGAGKADTVITYDKLAKTIKVENDKETIVYDAKDGTQRAKIAKNPVAEIENTAKELAKHQESVQGFVESLDGTIIDPNLLMSISNILTGNYDKLSIPQLDGILKLLNPKQQEKFGDIMENLLKINNC